MFWTDSNNPLSHIFPPHHYNCELFLQMELVTNSNNINSLKAGVCARLAGLELPLRFVSPGRDSRETLPVLRVAGEGAGAAAELFDPTATAVFLLQTGGRLSDSELAGQETTLHWEASRLYPAVLGLLGRTGEPGLAGLRAALAGLAPPHQSPSLADILVWCDLYPVLTDPVRRRELADLAPTLDWWDSLATLPAFSAAAAKFGTGLDGCRAALPSLLPARVAAAAPLAAQPAAPATAATQLLDPALVAAARNSWTVGPAPLPQCSGPAAPRQGDRNILITSALPYVNNVPHLGNIVGCVLSADVFARFARQRGYNVLYVCGTDEYGTSTETKAVEEGLTPQQICDKYNKLHGEIYDWFNISFDKFGRTTTDEQTKIAQEIFWSLHRSGCTTEDSVEQLHCASCDRFLADRFVEGECPLPGCGYEDARGDQCDKCGKLINAAELVRPRCKLCGRTPQSRTSRHLFLDLPQLEKRLNAWRESAAEKWSNNARVIAQSWLRGGLQPRCITRDLKWGTPVPLEGFQDKVFYVWFDAPIGYISITAQHTPHWQQWWKNPGEVEYWQFMAKDNVPFHSVVFPSTLLGTGEDWTLVNRLMSTEYLNYEDAKFSKSRGVGVFGNDAQETGIPADVWRFYLLYIRPENQDSAFKWEDLMTKVNSELLANLGNFINRATKFTKDQFGGRVPEMSLTEEDWELVARVNQELSSYLALLEEAREREGIVALLNISRLGNQAMQHSAPWKLVKGGVAERARAGTVVGLCVNLACLLSSLLEPFLPGLAAKLREQLAVPAATAAIPDHFHLLLPPGHTIGSPSPLVEEIKPDTIARLKARYAGKQSERAGSESRPVGTGVPGAEELEVQVAQQGEKVRQLKTDKAEKAVIDTEIKKLLELKKLLSAATGQPAEPAGGKKKGKKK